MDEDGSEARRVDREAEQAAAAPILHQHEGRGEDEPEEREQRQARINLAGGRSRRGELASEIGFGHATGSVHAMEQAGCIKAWEGVIADTACKIHNTSCLSWLSAAM